MAQSDTFPPDPAMAARGIELLRLIGGKSFDSGIKPLAAVSPDLARITVDFGYGAILSRPGLELRLRQACTVGVLIALGSAQPQLKFHMDGFINVGGTPEELVEIVIAAGVVIGFPATIDSVPIVRQVFKDLGVAFTPPPATGDDGTGRYARGLEILEATFGVDAPSYVARLEAIDPDMARWTVEVAFGEVLARPRLDLKMRQIALIAMLATVGNRVEAFQLHLRAALLAGVTRAQIVEVLIQLAMYAGFPTALNAVSAARELLENPPEPAPAPTQKAEIPKGETRAVRHARGAAILAKASATSGEAVVRSFDDLAPDIGAMILEHGYGDIFCRTAIDLKTRELTACAAVAGRGSKAMETPLRVHVNAALTAGASRAEIVETLLNVMPYTGFPNIQQALRIAGEEFAKRGV